MAMSHLGRELARTAIVLTLALTSAAGAAAQDAAPRWKTWLVLDEAGEANMAVAVSADGNLVAASDGEGGVKVWRVADGVAAGAFTARPVGSPLALSFSNDGQSLRLAGREAVVAWDTSSRRQQAFFRWPLGEVEAAAFAPDGRSVALGGG